MPANDPTRSQTPARSESTKLAAPSELTTTASPSVSVTGDFDQSRSADVMRPGSIPGYELLEALGKGGMGVVWKARQDKLNRVVALKMVIGGDKGLIRFLAEAEAVAAVRHPNVVQVFEYGEHDGQPFLAMEYLTGGSLSGRLKAEGRLSPVDAAKLVATLADAMQAAHDQGIVHRDLKPGNVMYNEAGEPKVTDFGLAKRGNTDLTATQAVMGTPAYMAPEQARGATKFVGPQADVYALGVILYECLTGTLPFSGQNAIALIRKVAEEEPESPRKRNPRLPRDIERVCLKCLSKDPADRYRTAADLAQDLRRFAAGEPVAVRPAGLMERGYKWVRRKPTQAAAYGLTLAVLLLLGIGTVVFSLWRSAEREKANAESARDGEKSARTVAEQAQGEAIKQRDAAVTAEKGEKKARSIAEGALAGEAKARNIADSEKHGRTIEVAHQEWRENNVPVTLALLAGTPEKVRGWEWHFVKRLCHSEILELKGHTGFVNAVFYSKDGAKILTASVDGSSKVWDAKTGAEIRTHPGRGHLDAIATFSPDGSLGVTAGAVWDTQTGAIVNTIEGQIDSVQLASISADGTQIVTAGKDTTAKIWNVKSGQLIHTLSGHKSRLQSAFFSPNGAHVVTMSWDLCAKIWDAKSGKLLHTLSGANPVQTRPFSPDGSQLVTAGMFRDAIIWDVQTGTKLFSMQGHGGRVWAASFSADGKQLVTGSADGTAQVWVWNGKVGRRNVTLRGHTGPILSAAFSPDGSRVVTGSEDRTAKVWNAKDGSEFRTLEAGHTLAVNPAGTLAVSRDLFYQIANVSDVSTGKTVRKLKGHAGEFNAAAFSADGSRIVTGSSDKTAKLWDTKTGNEITTLTGHTGNVIATAFSPNGQQIITGCIDGTAKIWDAKTWKVIRTLEGHTASIHAVAINRDGSQAVTASSDKTAKVWDARTGMVLHTLKGHSATIQTAAFNPDGSRVVTGAGNEVSSVLYNPQMAIDDTTARVWDAKTGEEILVLRGHTGRIWSASFSPDGSRIITGSEDKTARMWDALTGAEVLTLKENVQAVHFVSFTADGRRVFTGRAQGVSIWDATPLKPEAEMK